MVATTNPLPESNWEDLSWVQVIESEQSASINHDGLNEPFITATSSEEGGLPRMEYNVENFEAYIRAHSCDGPVAALS